MSQCLGAWLKLSCKCRGRPTREIEFDNALDIGGFRAFDYFGDGSFYLLDAPGVS